MNIKTRSQMGEECDKIIFMTAAAARELRLKNKPTPKSIENEREYFEEAMESIVDKARQLPYTYILFNHEDRTNVELVIAEVEATGWYCCLTESTHSLQVEMGLD